MGDRLNILFLADSLVFGGAEKHTVTLANRLDTSKFRLGLVYLKPMEHLLPELDCDRLDGVCCADFGRGMNWRGLFWLANYVKRWQPDVVVCVNQYPLFFGYLARLLSRVPFRIVEVFHTTELRDARSRRHQKIYQWFFNHSDRIVYVSQNQRRYWEARGIRADRGECIHNGIDTEHFRDNLDDHEKAALRARFSFSTEDFVVGICAALRPEKRHVDLLEAVALMRARGLSAKCLIIGDGPMRAEIESRIDALMLTGHVVISGFQADVRPFLSICDCMAIVSDAVETFSIAALEAMALGKPIVVSDIGGASEQVEHGENGFLFPRGDIRCLADHLCSLSNRVQQERFGGRAREIVERRFGVNKMIREYSRLFHRIGVQQ